MMLLCTVPKIETDASPGIRGTRAHFIGSRSRAFFNCIFIFVLLLLLFTSSFFVSPSLSSWHFALLQVGRLGIRYLHNIINLASHLCTSVFLVLVRVYATSNVLVLHSVFFYILCLFCVCVSNIWPDIFFSILSDGSWNVDGMNDVNLFHSIARRSFFWFSL